MAPRFIHHFWCSFLVLLTLFAACSDDAVRPDSNPVIDPPSSSTWTVDTTPAPFRGIASNGARTITLSDLGTFEFDGASWRQIAPGLTASEFTISPDGDIYAVSENVLWRLESDEWRVFFTPTSQGCDIYGRYFQFLGAIWAGDGGKIVAIGPSYECSVAYFGINFHYDGATWSEQWSNMGFGSCVWGTSESNVFAGGGHAIHRFDGTTWTKVYDTTASVIDIWGRSASDVYAIDYHTVYHYDGIEWLPIHTDNEIRFQGIGALVDGSVVVWGAEGRFTVQQGAQWISLSIPSRENLTGVWGPSLADLHIATEEGFLHKKGNTTTRLFGAPRLYWQSIFVASENDVYVAGEDGTLAHRGDSGWDPVLYEKGTQWLEVWGPAPNDIYLVGEQGRMMHYNGSLWEPQEPLTIKTLSAVWGIDGTIFVAGDGLVLKREGGAWSVMPGVPNVFFRDIWGTSTNDVFAVGAAGAVVHYDGTVWTPMQSGTQVELWAVRGFSRTDVFAGGKSAPFYGPTRYYAGTVLHYDGVSWTRMESEGIETVNAFWGTGPDQLFLASNGIFPLEGSTWGPSIGPGVKTLHGCSLTCMFAIKERSILRYEEQE